MGEVPAGSKKIRQSVTTDNSARFPGESRGLPLERTSGGLMDPSFRWDSGRAPFHALRVGSAGGELTRRMRVHA